MEASMSPLSVLGGDLQFARGLNVALPELTNEVIQSLPPTDLLKGNIEMMCRAFVLVQLGSDDQDQLFKTFVYIY